MTGLRIAIGDLAANIAAVTGPLEVLVWVLVIVVLAGLAFAIVRRL